MCWVASKTAICAIFEPLRDESDLYYGTVHTSCLLHVCYVLWCFLLSNRNYATDIISQWRDEWKSAPVVNSLLVDDPTIQQPGFYLSRCYWAPLPDQSRPPCILSKEVRRCSNRCANVVMVLVTCHCTSAVCRVCYVSSGRYHWQQSLSSTQLA